MHGVGSQEEADQGGQRAKGWRMVHKEQARAMREIHKESNLNDKQIHARWGRWSGHVS